MPEKHPTTDRPESELEVLCAMVVAQAALIDQLPQRLGELESRLAKDSHNSGKPPSSVPPLKRPPGRSQRQASGRKPGRQKGHPGAARALAEEPDHLIAVLRKGSCTCGRPRGKLPAQPLPERRQVVDLVIRREVTEYRILEGTCACGRTHRSGFRADDGIVSFATIRSYLSTLRKQSPNIFDALALTFRGCPPMPRLT